MKRTEYPLAEWEHFTAKGQARDGRILERLFKDVVTETDDAGVTRIFGDGERGDGMLWLRPQDVPPRVIAGDCGWPRTHPLEYRAMIQRGRAVIQLTEDEKVAARLAELPEPEVKARPATLEEIPRGAKGIGVKATEAGFEVDATYARGPRVDQYWRVAEISDTVMVRGKHADGRRFGAMWITKTSGPQAKEPGVTSWENETAYLMRDTLWEPCGIKELSAYLLPSE